MADNQDETENCCECAICMDPLRSGLNALPCGHVFHAQCVLRALERKKVCPLCRLSTTESQLLPLFLEIDTSAPLIVSTDVQALVDSIDDDSLSRERVSAALSSRDAKISMLGEKESALRSQLAESERKRSEIEEEKNQCEIDLKIVELSLDEHESALRGAQQQLMELKKQNNAMQTKINSYVSKVAAFEYLDDVKIAENAANIRIPANGDVRLMVRALTAETQKMQKEKHDLLGELQAVCAERDEFSRKVRIRDGKLEKLRLQLEEREQQLLQKQKQNQNQNQMPSSMSMSKNGSGNLSKPMSTASSRSVVFSPSLPLMMQRKESLDQALDAQRQEGVKPWELPAERGMTGDELLQFFQMDDSSTGKKRTSSAVEADLEETLQSIARTSTSSEVKGLNKKRIAQPGSIPSLRRSTSLGFNGFASQSIPPNPTGGVDTHRRTVGLADRKKLQRSFSNLKRDREKQSTVDSFVEKLLQS